MNKFCILMAGLVLAGSCNSNSSNTGIKVLLETSEGNITLLLYDDTPQHRDNFAKLVNDGFYDGVIFHRVIENFMIQSGDPNSKNPTPDGTYGSGGPNYKIPAEILPNHHHKKGALAAARTNNPEKASSGSQFYIVQGKIFNSEELEARKKFTPEVIKDYTTIGGTPHLDGEYTVFGEVLEGLDIVDKIAGTETRPGDRPVKDIFIKKAKIIK